MWIQSSFPRYIRMVMSQRSVTWSQQIYMRRNCLLPYQLNLCRCFSNVDNDKFENAIAGLSSNDKDPITVGNKQGRKKYNYSKEEKAVQKPEQDDRFITSIKKTRQMFKEAEVSFKSDESQKKSASADKKAKDRLNQSNDTPIKNKKAAPVKLKHKSTGKNEPQKHSKLPDDWTETFGTLASSEDKLELSAVAKEKSEFQESLASVTEEEEEKIFRHRPLVKHGRHPARWYGKRIQALGKEHKVAEAVEVFETWMLQQDRVQPTAYEFNSVVNILAQAGDVKKAFKLYRLMKSMKIYPKPMLYTCLFNACANTDYPQRGLKLAQKLRNEIFKTEYQPNFQNYQAMIKAFGMCGDINTAFNVADEAAERRVNGNLLASLLVACISDKEAGYRHALMVWRKFVQKGIRPEAKHYNLLIRAINECGIGHVQLMSNLLPPASTANIDEAYTTTDATLDLRLLDDGNQMESDSQHYEVLTEHMATDSDTQVYNTKQQRDFDYPEDGDNKPYVTISDNKPYVINYTEEAGVPDTQVYNTKQQQLRDFDYPEDRLTSSHSSDNKPYVINYTEEARVPELLAENDSMFENSSNGGTISNEIGNSSEGAVTDDWVISSPDTVIPDTKEWWQLDVFTKSDDKFAGQEQSLQPITSTTLPCVLYPDVHLPMTTDVSRIKTAKDRLAILGGLHALLDAMKHDRATGDIVTFTQLVNSVPPWQENELIIAMKVAGVVPDVDFYNHLIRKRSSQTYDHTGAMEVWDMILDEGLTPNLHTYGGLARACRNKHDAERLLNEMAAANMMPNELIISEMIRGSQLDSDYLKFLLRTMHEFDIKPKRTTILYIEKIIKKAKIRLVKIEKTGHNRYLKNFEQNVNSFISFYERWSKYNYLGDDQKKEKTQQHR